MAARVAHRAAKIFDTARRAGTREPLEAYAFDALAELINQDGAGPEIPVGADAKIIVRIDHSAFVRHTEPGETCEIAGIGPVPVSVVEEWMDDAFIAAILTEGEDVTKVVHLGPPRQRRRPPSPNRLTPPPTRPPGRGNGRATPRLSGRAGPGDGSGIAVDGLAHIDAGHLGIGQEVVRPSSVSAPTTSFSSR